MSGAGRPVARLLAPVVNRMLVLVLLLAGVAVAGVAASTQAVDSLTDRLQPASNANKDVLQDLSDMQAAVRAYVQTGQESALDEYEQALARLPGHERQVRQYAATSAELDLLVARQEQAAEAWIEDFAAVRTARPGGPGTFDRQLFRTGAERFAAFRDAHTDTVAALDERVREARAAAEVRLRGTILAVVLIGGLGWWGVARARRRLLSELAEPLSQLELVVQRMAGQDRTVRAAETGPREVRAVAAALNGLADAQARARSVELRIQDELRSLDTARDDFVSNVSHELRTPLTTIGGYLELVAEEFDGRMTPRHEKMVEASRRNVARLRLLIDDLLTLSRAESRDTSLTQVDLAAVLRDVVTDVRMTAARRGIRIEVAAPDGVSGVLGDRVMLHRALLNVLSNAVKFSRDDGTVEVEAARRGDLWTIEVRDHGIGIPSGEIERLGTRFFRASNAVSNEIAGTGLGIRIVQTIVDKHSGHMVINSEEGRGTTVTLALPAHGDDSAPDDEEAGAPVEEEAEDFVATAEPGGPAERG